MLPAECRRGLRSSAERNGTPPSASRRAPPCTETSVAKGDYATCCRAPPRCRGRWPPPSAAECHRAPQIAAGPRAAEHCRAAAGAAHRRALRSATVEDSEMGAALCARSRRGRTTARVCAATNPPSSIPPFSPTDRSRYATLKADQVPGDNCCGGVTTEVISRHGSRPGCNPRRQGGDNFWT